MRHHHSARVQAHQRKSSILKAIEMVTIAHFPAPIGYFSVPEMHLSDIKIALERPEVTARDLNLEPIIGWRVEREHGQAPHVPVPIGLFGDIQDCRAVLTPFNVVHNEHGDVMLLREYLEFCLGENEARD